MRWKLGLLVALTLVLAISVVPIRTHAVRYDPTNLPQQPGFGTLLANMYLTPGTAAALAVILLVAVLMGIRIIKG